MWSKHFPVKFFKGPKRNRLEDKTLENMLLIKVYMDEYGISVILPVFKSNSKQRKSKDFDPNDALELTPTTKEE